MRVLIIDADPTRAAHLTRFFTANKLGCEVAKDGEEALELLKLSPHDLVLQRITRLNDCVRVRRLRSAGISLPILALADSRNVDWRIDALGCGADDCLAVPCDLREVRARIHALVRRSAGRAESVIRTGKMAVNLEGRTVEIDGQPVPITKMEFALLEILCLRKGKLVTNDALMSRLYSDAPDEPDPRILNVMVCNLRRKFRNIYAPARDYIKTECRRGYRLADPPAERVLLQAA
jgi:two-component system cell cycle response regulator CtrA